MFAAVIYPAGNNAAFQKLLASEAPAGGAHWARAWDLAQGLSAQGLAAHDLHLPDAVSAVNPLLAIDVALFQESCRLLYASGKTYILYPDSNILDTKSNVGWIHGYLRRVIYTPFKQCCF